MEKEQIVITGGSEGIGQGLAKLFLADGCRVLITGRNLEKLERVAAHLPGLEIYQNDISKPEQREHLADYVKKTMPGITYLINNAGIQRRVGLAEDHAPWAERQAEIDTLFAAPVHLNTLLIPLLLEADKKSTLVNVTSGGAYIPQVFAPVYSACKAALHHYTLVLREALSKTSCEVIELIPPAVQTGLAGPGQAHGEPLEEFCNYVFKELKKRQKSDIGYGFTADLQVEINGIKVDKLLRVSADRFPTSTYRAAKEN